MKVTGAAQTMRKLDRFCPIWVSYSDQTRLIQSERSED
jgi:hypothetical protein